MSKTIHDENDNWFPRFVSLLDFASRVVQHGGLDPEALKYSFKSCRDTHRNEGEPYWGEDGEIFVKCDDAWRVVWDNTPPNTGNVLEVWFSPIIEEDDKYINYTKYYEENKKLKIFSETEE